MAKKNNEIDVISQKDSLLPIGIDDYGDLELSSGAKEKLGRLLISAKAGLVSATPIICKGKSSCPFISRCPIYQDEQESGEVGNYPIDKQCIVELNLVRDKFLDYLEELGIEHEIENSPTIRSQISKLTELDLYDYRIGLVLAGVTGESDGSLLLGQTIAINNNGEEIEQLQEHPAWKIRERIQKQRMEILDSLGATVKRKVWIDATLKRVSQENIFQKQMDILERVDQIVESLDTEEKK